MQLLIPAQENEYKPEVIQLIFDMYEASFVPLVEEIFKRLV